MASEVPLEFHVGSHVECRYDGGDMWYDGKITAKHPDGTYNVLYDDGDTEDFVPLMHLRPNEDAESSDDGEANAASASAGAGSAAGVPDLSALQDTLSPEALLALAGHFNVDAGIEIKPPTEEEIAAKKAAQQARLAEKARVLEETMKRLREEATQEEQNTQDRLGAPAIAPSSPAAGLKALREKGCVRFNGLVPPELCDELLNFINKRLDNAIGSLKPDEMTPDTGFGTILARKHRYDMYVRPEGVVQKCLSSMLTSPLGQEADGGGDDDDDKGSNGESESSPWTLLRLFQELFDGAADAKFSELSCIISDAGAPRQPLHPDTHWEEVAPIYSIFLALQDIDESMGPTVFLPATNNEECHKQFNADAVTKKAFLASREYRLSLLKKGDVAIFDARTLHCGGGNTSRRRAQLMFSLENPNRIIDELTDTDCRSCFKDLSLNLSDFAVQP